MTMLGSYRVNGPTVRLPASWLAHFPDRRAVAYAPKPGSWRLFPVAEFEAMAAFHRGSATGRRLAHARRIRFTRDGSTRRLGLHEPGILYGCGDHASLTTDRFMVANTVDP